MASHVLPTGWTPTPVHLTRPPTTEFSPPKRAYHTLPAARAISIGGWGLVVDVIVSRGRTSARAWASRQSHARGNGPTRVWPRGEITNLGSGNNFHASSPLSRYMGSTTARIAIPISRSHSIAGRFNTLPATCASPHMAPCRRTEVPLTDV